jgi:DNA-binding response OmpR family regulator
MLKKLNVLYVEKEDEEIKKYTIEALEFMSMNVYAVSNGEEAYSQYLKNKPDILISEIELPLLNGLDLVEKIRKEDTEIQIIIMTIYTNIEYFLKAIELSLVKYLLKPVSLNDLKNALVLCIDNIEKKRENLIKYFNKNDFYNLTKRHLFINDKTIKLDYHEREFLELLLKQNKRIVTYSQIEKEIWDKDMSSAAIRSLVRNLRKKLPLNVIENISKIGYKINIINN